MKIAIVGSRTINDEDLIYRICDDLFKKGDVLVSGGAKGVDSLAQEWAEKYGIETVIYRPNNPKDTKSYLERNKKIVDNSDLIVAMPKEHEILRSGTWSTIRYARKAGRRLHIVYPR